MPHYLHNILAGREQPAGQAQSILRDPVTGAELACAGGRAAGIEEGFAYARTYAAPALQELSYGERAARLAEVLKVLRAKRDSYYEIAQANSGTTQADSAIDIEGASFTLGYYAKLGAGLGDARTLLDGAAVPLSKDGSFRSQHILAPVRGLALFINAFNFPAWGLWEKAAPALLSGVPVVVKPATVTAWLTQKMVADVNAAGILPPGALSVVCGSSAGLLDALGPFDVLSFTGSAATAELIRAHGGVVRHSVRTNIEADSLNCSVLGEDAMPGTPAFDLYVKELAREITTKSGQRCTAVRRALVPAALLHAVGEALAGQLRQVTVGNPRNPEVRMGSLVSREQYENVQQGIAGLAAEARVLVDGRSAPLVDADPAVASCIGPTLLAIADGDSARLVHEHEVFGPVTTLLGYRDTAHALQLAHRGLGSLVSSAFSADDAWLSRMAVGLAGSHGRVHLVSPDVAETQTGHGNVMPASIHGGPGRAGGGEELGGLRGLGFYHRRSAVQASGGALEVMGASATRWD